MKKAALLLCSLLGCTGLGAAEQPLVLSPDAGQVFACTLAEGKTMDNVWVSMDALAKFPREQDPEFNIFLWTQMRGAYPYDFILGVNNGDMVKMAEGFTQVVTRPGWDAWAQDFGDTANCISGVIKSEQIRAGTLGTTAGRTPVAVVEKTFACNYREGSSPADVGPVMDYFKANYEKVDSAAAKTYSAWLWYPYRGTSGEWDFMFVGANPDFKTWAQSAVDYDATKVGQAIDAKFGAISTCKTALWSGYWIVPPGSPG
jgi:hypothetical protein